MGTKIPFYRQNISDTARAGQRVHAAASEITQLAFTETEMLAQLATRNAELSQAQIKLDPKEITKAMMRFDGGREDGLRAFKYLILAAKYRKDPAKRAAAVLLENVLRDYGWSISQFPNAKETNVLESIYLKIESDPELKAAVETINAQGAFSEMNTDNEEYKKSEKLRTEVQANSSNMLAGEICDKVAEASEIIIDFVEVMNRVKPNAEYQKFLEQVEVIASEMNQAIENRRKKPEELEEELEN